MKSTKESISELLVQAHKRSLLLPNFQRDFVWSIEFQKRLTSSVMLGIPCGSLLLLEGQSDDFGANWLGISAQTKTSGVHSCRFLLDGQQRLSTLNQVFSDPFGTTNWEEAVRSTYYRLRYRWAVKLAPEMGEQDIFGYENLSFQQVPMEVEPIQARLREMRILLDKAETSSDASWFHPGWKGTLGPSATQAQLDVEVKKRAALQQLVPLWRVTSDVGKPKTKERLHSIVIQQIALDRGEQLEAQVRGGTISKALRESIDAARPDLADVTDLEKLAGGIAYVTSAWEAAVGSFIEQCVKSEMPIVELPANEIDRAILTFEQMNTGGTRLSTFDLLTAKLALVNSKDNLGEMVYERITSFHLKLSDALWGTIPLTKPKEWTPSNNFAVDKDAPSLAFKDSFLWVLALLVAKEKKQEFSVELTKQSQILRIDPEQLARHWKAAVDAVLRAYAFLQIRCGVRSETRLRNQLLVPPIALALSGKNLPRRKTLDRIEFWYWVSVLTNTYTERQNQNAVMDATALEKWIATGKMPTQFSERRKRVLKDQNYSDKKFLTRESEDAGVKTDVGEYLLQYELSSAPNDLMKDEPRVSALDGKLHDHHLVPLGSAKSIHESAHDIRKGNSELSRLLNSPLNRAYISEKTNSRISSMSIKDYLGDVSSAARGDRGLPDVGVLLKTEKGEAEIKAVMCHRFDHFSTSVAAELAYLGS